MSRLSGQAVVGSETQAGKQTLNFGKTDHYFCYSQVLIQPVLFIQTGRPSNREDPTGVPTQTLLVLYY